MICSSRTIEPVTVRWPLPQGSHPRSARRCRSACRMAGRLGPPPADLLGAAWFGLLRAEPRTFRCHVATLGGGGGLPAGSWNGPRFVFHEGPGTGAGPGRWRISDEPVAGDMRGAVIVFDGGSLDTPVR